MVMVVVRVAGVPLAGVAVAVRVASAAADEAVKTKDAVPSAPVVFEPGGIEPALAVSATETFAAGEVPFFTVTTTVVVATPSAGRRARAGTTLSPKPVVACVQ